VQLSRLPKGRPVVHPKVHRKTQERLSRINASRDHASSSDLSTGKSGRNNAGSDKPYSSNAKVRNAGWCG
jgi:hypothetical protein